MAALKRFQVLDNISSLTNVTPSALRFSLSKGAKKSSFLGSREVDRLLFRTVHYIRKEK